MRRSSYVKKPLSSDVDSGFLLFYNWSLLFLYTA